MRTAAAPRGGPGAGGGAALAATSERAQPPALQRARWAASDAWTIAKRDLLKLVRLPDLLIFSLVQPIMFVLLFVYVFGGAIRIPGVSYADYLLPGILVQTVAFGSVATGVGLAEDLQKGIVDRFRSLPMARSAVLLGRTLADLMRNLLSVAVMLGVGVAVGFRFHGTALADIAGIGFLVAFDFTLSWVGATIGLLARSTEAASSAGFIWLFPLTFASSAFVPVSTMPGWLRAFASNSPVSLTVNAVRGLLVGGPVAHAVVTATAWLVGILVVFVTVSVRRWQRMGTR